MTDSTAMDTRRADDARRKLLRDIVEIKKMGNQMIENTETALHKAPVVIGLGVVALVGVTLLARRRPKRTFSGFERPHSRSFFAEAARSAALSALGVLSARLTQRLLVNALNGAEDKPQ
ncbi:MAG TPA: hypothetical protein VFK05_23675 [Polyangiaceae bacterium]|nr:hypothetical protein [Polyangiaceae bacterium]